MAITNQNLSFALGQTLVPTTQLNYTGVTLNCLDSWQILILSACIRSAERDKALLLCGWRFDKETNSVCDNSFLERLEREGAYPRAAAIAVFNLCLRNAIEILNRGSNEMPMATNLNVVAMALSGFTEDRNSMWREMCLKSRSQLSDPYLRATFAFLTAENDVYDSVLVNCQIISNLL